MPCVQRWSDRRLRPYDHEMIKAFEVSRSVNCVKNNAPEWTRPPTVRQRPLRVIDLSARKSRLTALTVANGGEDLRQPHAAHRRLVENLPDAFGVPRRRYGNRRAGRAEQERKQVLRLGYAVDEPWRNAAPEACVLKFLRGLDRKRPLRAGLRRIRPRPQDGR